MAHVKGHIDVPAQKTNKNEVKNSFFSSFKDKLKSIKKVPHKFEGPKEIVIKVFNKGGKVGK